MSIKSLFEDIADAIREKSGSSDTYTPDEMPSAIRSIPSGSGTASGVSYDNTSSRLTASNVQAAIDELSGDVSTINSDLSEKVVVLNNIGTMSNSSLMNQFVLDEKYNVSDYVLVRLLFNNAQYVTHPVLGQIYFYQHTIVVNTSNYNDFAGQTVGVILMKI